MTDKLLSFEEIRTIIKKYDLDSFDMPYPTLDGAKKLDFDVYGYDPKTSTLEPNINGVVYYDDKEIFLNNVHTVQQQRFTLGHELGHIAINKYFNNNTNEDIIDYSKNNSTEPSEINADRFSSELLMPKESFIEHYNTIKGNGLTQQIRHLRSYFRVPEQAILRRLVELDLEIRL